MAWMLYITNKMFLALAYTSDQRNIVPTPTPFADLDQKDLTTHYSPPFTCLKPKRLNHLSPLAPPKALGPTDSNASGLGAFLHLSPRTFPRSKLPPVIARRGSETLEDSGERAGRVARVGPPPRYLRSLTHCSRLRAARARVLAVLSQPRWHGLCCIQTAAPPPL